MHAIAQLLQALQAPASSALQQQDGGTAQKPGGLAKLFGAILQQARSPGAETMVPVDGVAADGWTEGEVVAQYATTALPEALPDSEDLGLASTVIAEAMLAPVTPPPPPNAEVVAKSEVGASAIHMAQGYPLPVITTPVPAVVSEAEVVTVPALAAAKTETAVPIAPAVSSPGTQTSEQPAQQAAVATQGSVPIKPASSKPLVTKGVSPVVVTQSPPMATATPVESVVSTVAVRGASPLQEAFVSALSQQAGDSLSKKSTGKLAAGVTQPEGPEAVVFAQKPQVTEPAKVLMQNLAPDIGKVAPAQHAEAPASPAVAERPPPAVVQIRDAGQFIVKSVRYLAGKHDEVVTVQLVPRSLGEMQIAVSAQRDGLEIVISAASQAARDTIEAQIAGLRESFARDGTEVTKVTVQAYTPSDAGPGQSGSGQSSTTGHAARHHSKFAGDAQESEGGSRASPEHHEEHAGNAEHVRIRSIQTI